MKRLLATAFYILLSIAGLNFLLLCAIFGVQVARGELKKEDGENMLRVLGGQQRYVVPSDMFNQFQKFQEDEAAARRELEENRGFPADRVPAAMAAAEEVRILRESEAAYKKALEEERARVLEVRGEVEVQKRQVAALRKNLDDERATKAIVERDEATAMRRKMIAEMDAGNVAEILTRIVRDPVLGGATEAARILRMHMKADRQAEVMDEIQEAEVRQQIFPLLENPFAGVPPGAVVTLFRNREYGAGQMHAYLTQMNPEQALGVYLLLEPKEREALAPYLLNPR